MELLCELSADLSTLASVVTTLATMGKDRDSSSGADTSEDVPNGDMSPESNQAAKAFDALAKALQPQLDQVLNQAGNPLTPTVAI